MGKKWVNVCVKWVRKVGKRRSGHLNIPNVYFSIKKLMKEVEVQVEVHEGHL